MRVKILFTIDTPNELNDYYPYGLWNPSLSVRPALGMENKYKFQSKELLSEVNPNTQNFGWRGYDPVRGRWDVVDPSAANTPHWTPFRFGFDNPVKFIDPNGKEEKPYLIFNGSTKSLQIYDDNETAGDSLQLHLRPPKL